MDKHWLWLLLASTLFPGCATGYRGTGEFHELTRTYVPVIGVTRGYSVEMPAFTPETDIVRTYSLQGLPRQNTGFNVEIAVYIPTERLPFDRQREIDVSVPDGHVIHCAIVDRNTGRTLQERTEKVGKLAPTMSMAFRGTPFVRHLLQLSFADIPKRATLEMRLEYRINGVPLKREMMLFVVNDAPLA